MASLAIAALVMALALVPGPARADVLAGYSCVSLDDDPDKPAWVNAWDLDGDGMKEIVVSVFAGSGPTGAGHLALYKSVDGAWRKTVVKGSEGIKFPNDPTVADVDGDGDPDLILPAGFLASTPKKSGGLMWFENLGGAKDWRRHDIVTGQKLFYHAAILHDLDGDGRKDILTVGEYKNLTGGSGAEVHVFKGLGTGAFATTPTVLMTDALGSLPFLADLDNDGDLDILSAQYFARGASAVWLENLGPAGWEKRIIEDRVGPAIQLSLIDGLCGDARKIAVLSNHVNTADDPSGPREGVFLHPVPQDSEELRRPWPGKLISEGIQCRKSPAVAPQAAPGVFRHGDVDHDGDLDLVVHGDGDPRVFLLEQTEPGLFATRVLVSDVPQGGVAVEDLDGDGRAEILVTSYEQNRLLLIRREASVRVDAPANERNR